jgi:hypothetical protein
LVILKGVILPLAITLAVQAIFSLAMIAPSVMAPVAAADLGVSAHGKAGSWRWNICAPCSRDSPAAPAT